MSILLLDKNTQGVNGHGLVGGLLSSLKLYPFMERGTINSQEDLNTTISGTYRVNDGLSSPITNGQLICCGMGTDLAIQKFIDWAGANVYIRNYWYGTWHSWKKITIEG